MSSDKKNLLFWFSVLFIVAVSSYDSYMSVLEQESLYALELNPLARALLALDGGGVSLLIGFKTFGTSIVVIACMLLKSNRYRYLGIVMAALVAVQIGVLLSYSPLMMLPA